MGRFHDPREEPQSQLIKASSMTQTGNPGPFRCTVLLRSGGESLHHASRVFKKSLLYWTHLLERAVLVHSSVCRASRADWAGRKAQRQV